MAFMISEHWTTLVMSAHDDVTTPPKIRILIVDDHEAIRSALAALLSEEPDLAVVATAENAEEALNVAQHQRLDLAIVDICLGRTNGLDLTKLLHVRYPNLRVLILSMHDAAVYGIRAAQAGASGYVAKQEALETLVPAVHRVFEGHTYFPNEKRSRP